MQRISYRCANRRKANEKNNKRVENGNEKEQRNESKLKHKNAIKFAFEVLISVIHIYTFHEWNCGQLLLWFICKFFHQSISDLQLDFFLLAFTSKQTIFSSTQSLILQCHWSSRNILIWKRVICIQISIQTKNSFGFYFLFDMQAKWMPAGCRFITRPLHS